MKNISVEITLWMPGGCFCNARSKNIKACYEVSDEVADALRKLDQKDATELNEAYLFWKNNPDLAELETLVNDTIWEAECDFWANEFMYDDEIMEIARNNAIKDYEWEEPDYYNDNFEPADIEEWNGIKPELRDLMYRSRDYEKLYDILKERLDSYKFVSYEYCEWLSEQDFKKWFKEQNAIDRAFMQEMEMDALGDGFDYSFTFTSIED